MDAFKANNINEAIALAETFREAGKYDWFRGQRDRLWAPHTTLFRFQRQNKNWKALLEPKLSRFHAWMKQTPGLSPVADQPDQFFAIAQHYGIPTHYLDFSTVPAVAGYFAADGGVPGDTGVIFCLRTSDLSKFWDDISKAVSDFPPLELISVEVPNLWRLEAQQGKFLFCPSSWDFIYDMDRIEFPQTGMPAYPTRSDIYPPRKSQLELLLDQFFDYETRLENSNAFKEMLKEAENKNSVHFYQVASPKDFYYPDAFIGGVIPEHQSWADIASWLHVDVERHHEVLNVRKEINLDLSQEAEELQIQCRLIFSRVLADSTGLRSHVVHWEFQGAKSKYSDSKLLTLNNGLNRIWDGLRRLPCRDHDIATSLANWIALWRLGYGQTNDQRVNQHAAERVFGGVIRVEFGASDDSCSRGYVATESLRAAVRSDIVDLLNDECVSHIESVYWLMQQCFSVVRLYDFNRLWPLFIHQVVPTQMDRQSVIFFHPARLDILGLP
ncbi:FRG domain-containing protein [Amphritea pacifica]|uniref:FRG domain-containing protein n=1 Tax=Amphritea pacifica TaxID=2811233 RepID=A0ABS2W334_9GAMM|nr:FRG domain-containing protein [Amphritea pacifica]